VRYTLFGLDELREAGWVVRHSLEPPSRPGRGARTVGRALGRVASLGGGYSGDFAGVLGSRRAFADADVVFSSVDTVGIPAVLLGRLGLVRRPLVYAAIGLPERLSRLRGTLARTTYRQAFRRVHTIVAYGAGEADAIREWLGSETPSVRFVPFGVNTEHFHPEPRRGLTVDVVSLGSDTNRDFALLREVAQRRPDWSVHVVGSVDNTPEPSSSGVNLSTETDVPFEDVRDRLASARVVALPVRENSYSGATTVLLQSMALGKPVVVSRTAAIARGYHLEDGVNCLLVEPGDTEALERAIADLLADPERAAALGVRARETVERHLTWTRFTERIHEVLAAAAGRTTVSA
jgi:glycosyltransferase involved in cell wall biosynthesis